MLWWLLQEFDFAHISITDETIDDVTIIMQPLISCFLKHHPNDTFIF